ncbi:adenosylcobinamide-GDP ribazoletransferase [Rhodoferax sp.]|uniref:adenosylcobinamide-GDP ribazoletransferase n=1 Tax=Rhodoferax sp. TaxID=50421 RepID=UPI0026364F1F|nr:adenosylcobinamide-GDP ribazoletransferase [Rhodoferax sp.]MDD2810576.1 adenosylcobinamide-GDP ribazoletransferase [Rhodoferax sp.]MDD5480923.1 adenosylcobinamide-GDP ribazoletransferase [Rhodoferax sp.]
MQFIRHYLLSLQFFTRIPVTGALAQWVGFSPAMLRASAGHFPGVGVLVGLLVAAFTAGLLWLLPATGAAPLVAAALGTVFGVMLTGAFHEDGLADVADGLGGSVDRERALIIMKDSRVGAFGAIAVVLAVLCKVALLALLGDVSAALMVVALLVAHVVSRTWQLLTIRLLPHVGDLAGSKSKPLADHISATALATGFIWCFSALALVLYAQVATNYIAIESSDSALFQAFAQAVLASLLAWAWMARWFWQRLGGFTGDCLGATQQVCELAFYLGLALSL